MNILRVLFILKLLLIVLTFNASGIKNQNLSPSNSVITNQKYKYNLQNTSFQTEKPSIKEMITTKKSKNYHTKTCEKDSDCKYMNSCTEEVRQCYHDSFFPLQLRGVIGLILLILGLSLSSAVGLGGGTLLIPILILEMNFYTHQAIPISKTLIFSNAFITYLFQINERHPTKNKISIDYSTGTFIIPGLLMGSVMGVVLNKLLNGIFLTFLLSIILVLLSVKTGYKAYEIYLKETQLENSNFQLEEVTSSDCEDNNSINGPNKIKYTGEVNF